jgi:hypothetical protein
MEIEIRSVLTNAYDNWPRTRQVPKGVLVGGHPCARTGLNRLAGPIQKFILPLKEQLFAGIIVPRLHRKDVVGR